MTARRWARSLGPVTVDVACSGATHRVLLRRGSVVLADHEAAAEAVVAALGGEPPACLQVLRSWRARRAWEEALRPRGPGFHQLYRRPPLPPALAGPLHQGVVLSWERRAARGDAEATRMLEAAIRHRAEPALASALRVFVAKVGGGPVERCAVEVGAGALPTVSGQVTPKGSSVSLRLSRDWLRTVALAGRPGSWANPFVASRRPEVLVLGWVERSPRRWSAVLRGAGDGG